MKTGALFVVLAAALVAAEPSYYGSYTAEGEWCRQSLCKVVSVGSLEDVPTLLEAVRTCANSGDACTVTASVKITIPIEESAFACKSSDYLGFMTSSVTLPEDGWTVSNNLLMTSNLTPCILSSSGTTFSGTTGAALTDVCGTVQGGTEYTATVNESEREIVFTPGLERDVQIPLGGSEACPEGSIVMEVTKSVSCEGECPQVAETTDDEERDTSGACYSILMMSSLVAGGSMLL